MKQFFGAFFGSIIGLVVAGLIIVGVLVAVVKSSIGDAFKGDKEKTTVKENSILKIVIDGKITEREIENPFAALGNDNPFGGSEGMALPDLVHKINAARDDKNIKGIYLNIQKMACGLAAVEELYSAMENFKKSGKFIYTYGEYFNLLDYYLASASSRVYLNPNGTMSWHGVRMNAMFMKNMFEKLEVDIQIFRHGKYKAAVEPFFLDKMSAANREQSRQFVNGMWSNMLEKISKNRKVPVSKLNEMADNLRISNAEDAVGTLVDNTLYEDEVMNELKTKIGLKEKDKINFVDLEKYDIKKKLKLKMPKIAVIYAVGQISGGEGDDEEIGSLRISKAIRDARLDSSVKAIVLRVNSPGGSALASDVIWRETVLAKKAKPFIVSMGDLAASGGYYISCAADKIYAQKNTITGSIGVFGMMPNLQKLFANKFGITFDTVKSNVHSDIGSPFHPIDKAESESIQKMIEKIYDTFITNVAEARHLTKAEVDSMGQGRVWLGSDAIKLKLVDDIGGLQDAIAYAAGKAKLKDYKIKELPRVKNPFESFMGGGKEAETRFLKHQLGNAYVYFKQLRQFMDMQGVQARLPFEMVIE